MVELESLGVRNQAVWKQIKYLLLGATILFLINNFFGFDNALTEGTIPHWQGLIHLHSGSIGWITLSALTMAIWLFSGDRDLSETYVSRVKIYSWLVILAFAGYVISFGVAFSQGNEYMYLLPIFGTLSAVMIWVGMVFSIVQFSKIKEKTAPQLMIMCALIISSLGALMGVLRGLQITLDTSVFPNSDLIGAHAVVMESYLLLVSSAIVGWYLGRNTAGKYTRGALAQALLLTIGPIIAWLGILLEREELVGAVGLFLIIAAIIFIVRNVRGLVRLNPLRQGPGGWIFFGGIWTIIWIIVFVSLIFLFVSGQLDEESESAFLDAFFVLFVHASFVGMMTNLILGVLSVRGYAARNTLSWAEPIAMWLLNLGLILFVLLKYTSDSRLGSIVMGVGVVIGVLTMIVRLISSNGAEKPAMAAGD